LELRNPVQLNLQFESIPFHQLYEEGQPRLQRFNPLTVGRRLIPGAPELNATR